MKASGVDNIDAPVRILGLVHNAGLHLLALRLGDLAIDGERDAVRARDTEQRSIATDLQGLT